jgi:hypothetical protein
MITGIVRDFEPIIPLSVCGSDGKLYSNLSLGYGDRSCCGRRRSQCFGRALAGDRYAPRVRIAVDGVLFF